jgi:hypothetical protein
VPAGTERLGTSDSGCLGEVVLHPVGQPAGGEPFGLRATGAPPESPGVVLIGLSALETPLLLAETVLWVDPNSPLWVVAFPADEHGYASADFALGPDLAGATFHAQALFPATVSCPVDGGVFATGALRLTAR